MKHLHIADVAAPQPPADLSAWMAEKTREFEAEFAGRRALWDQPRHLRVIDGGGSR